MRMWKVLNEGLTCYADRLATLNALYKMVEDDFAQERREEDELWRMEMPGNGPFYIACQQMIDNGQIDGYGGHETRRVYKAWLDAGKPKAVKKFIRQVL